MFLLILLQIIERMKFWLTAFSFIFLIVCGTSTTCLGQESANRFLHWFKDDPVAMVSEVTPQRLLTVSAVGIGISAIMLHDASSSKNMQYHYADAPFLDFANRWGNWKIAGSVSAGVFATSLLTKNTKFQDAAFTSLQSFLLTKITVNTSKFLFARQRPYQNDHPHYFDFMEMGAASFPSGHTATAFALVTPWMMYYPGPLTYALMAIAVGTAIARVAKGAHWLSDVSAGAAVGFSIARYLSKKHLNLQSNRIDITPTAGVNNFSLTVNLSF